MSESCHEFDDDCGAAWRSGAAAFSTAAAAATATMTAASTVHVTHDYDFRWGCGRGCGGDCSCGHGCGSDYSTTDGTLVAGRVVFMSRAMMELLVISCKGDRARPRASDAGDGEDARNAAVTAVEMDGEMFSVLTWREGWIQLDRVELGARQRFESHASQASGDA